MPLYTCPLVCCLAGPPRPGLIATSPPCCHTCWSVWPRWGGLQEFCFVLQVKPACKCCRLLRKVHCCWPARPVRLATWLAFSILSHPLHAVPPPGVRAGAGAVARACGTHHHPECSHLLSDSAAGRRACQLGSGAAGTSRSPGLQCRSGVWQCALGAQQQQQQQLLSCRLLAAILLPPLCSTVSLPALHQACKEGGTARFQNGSCRF